MITLRELGPKGLKERIEAQDREEMLAVGGGSMIDLPGQRSPSALGVGGARTRKTEMSMRVEIDQERHRRLILAEVWRLYNTPAGRQQIGKHVDVTRNPLQKVANALAVAYKRPPTRSFEDGSERLEKAWREAVIDEGQYNLQAKLWARYALICNVIHVIPQVFEGELVFDEIMPYASDVVFGPGERKPSILVYLSDGDGWTRVAVDNERFLYLDQNWEVVRQFEHGYTDPRTKRPMQPWTEWRTHAVLGSQDYWDRGRGSQLVDTTLKVGVVNAAMAAKRRAGDSKQPVLTADSHDEAASPGQALGGEGPIFLTGGVLSVEDLTNPVQPWVDHIDADEEALAESFGLQRGAVDKSKSSAESEWSEHKQISGHRDEMIPSLHRADMETSIKAAVVMRADGHRLAGRIPPKKVATTLKIRFQEHTFLERGADRMEYYALERSAGLASHVDQRQREHPDEDRATAERRVQATIEERNRFSEQLAQRNLSADAGQDADNLAQLQGREGGQVKGPPQTSQPDGGA